MSYFRSFLFNFLAAFFINRVAPGIQIMSFEQVPNIGADLLFSIALGFLNASVFPALTIFDLHPSDLKIGIVTAVISFSAFTLLAFVSFGVSIVSPAGVLIGGAFTWIVAFITNHLEFKRDTK